MGSERFEPAPGGARFSKEVDRRVAGSLSIGRAARRCVAILGKSLATSTLDVGLLVRSEGGEDGSNVNRDGQNARCISRV